MQLHVFQHVPFEGLGSIRTWADEAGMEPRLTHFFRNDPLPPRAEVTHLIVMGGPMGTRDHARYPWLEAEKAFIRKVIDAGGAVLGVCLGAQLMAEALGARVYRNPVPEIGWYPIYKDPEALEDEDAAFLPPTLEVFHWHGDTFDIPPGTRCLACSDACRNQGFYSSRRIVGLQFHLETTSASLAALIAHCSDELADSPYIQTAADMRGVKHRFAPNQQVMAALLNGWVAA